MKHGEAMVRLARLMLWALAAGLLAGAAAGCGASAPGASPVPLGSSSAPFSSAVVSAADVEAAGATSRTDEQVDWPYREFELRGVFRIDDFTDRTAALRTVTGTHDELWLLNLSSGARRKVLARATSGGARWWISGVRISETWAAWEELERGDDLRESVTWRLFVAPLRGSSLGIGKPRVVASASNRRASRPLFDLDGSRLVWISTPAGRRSTAGSLVMMRDLAASKERVLYRAGGALGTVGFTDGRVVVTETPSTASSPQKAKRFLALDAELGRVEGRVDVPSTYGLSHWPAWRHGWLVWAPFPSSDATYPELLVRSAAGRVYGEGGLGVDPCIVGDYVFYQSDRDVAPGAAAVAEVRMLRLSEMRSSVLVSGEIEEEIWWHAPIGSPDIERRYVVYGDNALAASRSSQVRTRVRVYDLE